MDNIQEIWKDCVGYEGLYQVSSQGNVRSNKRLNQITLQPRLRSDGYLEFSLTLDCNPKSYRGHRLVALAFIPNPENKPQINHINGIKTDNRLENLEWCTNYENHIHAVNVLGWGNVKNCRPKNHPGNKLTEQMVLEIRSSTDSAIKLGLKYGVHRNYIYDIKKHKWRNDVK